ncbi:1-aminocyclopropane-1-carboxylate oxidase homolog 1-like isoform X2 [Hordeum vulgare subsp. vulgare]|uniref:1-aminocyclopropane-1-carboxylate oxidase homolog 1-like isoform X2 n=1 Tax=Hordeum vulgare subsp. vulgare TaxID=112509 RepID=UPI001D1A5681|nr:1-aminocyclopropane-1-carboxylate oxidase homolog 1-like isoform X2 [Hordeum vulgare subsp. vulgare]
MAAADDYDAAVALAEFQAARAGVRGLVESGITSVPPLFLTRRPRTSSPSPPPVEAQNQPPLFTIPSVDLALPLSSTLPLIRAAARSCGFFHVTNHGVDAAAVDSAVSAVRAFHEQPLTTRSAFYAPASVGSITYSTIPIQTGKSKTTSAGPLLPWRDTLQVRFGPPPAPDLAHLPPACRDALVRYQLLMTELGKKMAGLLSEALGVGAERLERAMRVEGLLMACHYYPPCPEPARVVGSLGHTDPSLFTVLAQDGVGGLQVRLHDGRWADVLPVPGSLLLNIGDVLKAYCLDLHVVLTHSCESQGVFGYWVCPLKDDSSGYLELVWMTTQ